jgi:uncharacterized membrane protein
MKHLSELHLKVGTTAQWKQGSKEWMSIISISWVFFSDLTQIIIVVALFTPNSTHVMKPVFYTIIDQMSNMFQPSGHLQTLHHHLVSSWF